MDELETEFARSHALPLKEIVGKHTLYAIRSTRTARAAILKRTTGFGQNSVHDLMCLTPWRKLTKSHLSEILEILNSPHSYWNGWPMYRRFPPRPNFAIQMSGSAHELVVLIDLHNPGWIWSCADERYWGFNFAGSRLAGLAKSIFPEFASKRPGAIWRKGAIEKLLIPTN